MDGLMDQEMTNASSTVTSALNHTVTPSRLAPAQSSIPFNSLTAEPGHPRSTRASNGSDHKSVFEVRCLQQCSEV